MSKLDKRRLKINPDLVELKKSTGFIAINMKRSHEGYSIKERQGRAMSNRKVSITLPTPDHPSLKKLMEE